MASPAQHRQHLPVPEARTQRPSGPIEFTDVTAKAGIHFKHNTGAFGKKYLPETMGSGVCFLDYDNDGWQDILLINSMDWPGHKSGKSYSALYHNNHDGTFTDVTRQAGLARRNVRNGLRCRRLRQRWKSRYLHHSASAPTIFFTIWVMENLPT